MSIGKPTLIVHTTYLPVATTPAEEAGDPERAGARTLGLELYDLVTRPSADPLAWGAGVPVRIATHPDQIDLDEATHVVIVPVLGQLAHDREDVRQAAIAAMRRWRGRSSVHVLPVLTAGEWRDSEAARPPERRLPVKPLLTDLYVKDDPRQATLNEIVLSLARILAGNDPLATRLFISHAKGDLDGTERAAEHIRDHVQRRTTGPKPFFDQVSLLAGEDLDAQIDENAQQGVFIAVRGDSYSSRSWCQRELLKAKRRRLTILTVEVLSSGERRSSAYSGNGPTIVWPRGNPAVSASRVVTMAMVECVRRLLFLAEATRIASTALPGDAVTMARAPELLDVPLLRSGTEGVVIVLHPEPELAVHERDLLRDLDKRLHAVTPTTAFSGAIGRAIRAPLDGWQVALSLSDDVREGEDGVRLLHVSDATVFLARSLLGAGAAIAYGGDFRRSGYTELLAQLVTAYNQTARKPADLLHSYLAAHFAKPSTWTFAHTAHHLGRYGQLRSEAKLAAPEVGADLKPHRAALYVSDMRRVMALYTQARVALHGTVTPRSHHGDGYRGRYPGVVEEAWRTLEADRPLYVAGGFGGAARLIVDLLEDADRIPRELDEATWSGTKDWDDLVVALDADPDFRALGVPATQMELARRVRALGRPHMHTDETSLRWNGLTLDENRALFRTRDPMTLAALVLKGLVCRAARETSGKLRIELVEGDVTGATDVDVLVFPSFSDLDLDGAGAALDHASGGAARRAHRTRNLVSPATRTLGADFLYAADLGAMNAATGDPASAVRAAALATAEMARRYRFGRIGLVTFLGNVAGNLHEVVDAMIDGLRGVLPDAQLVWYERDPARSAMLASILGAPEKAAKLEVTRVVAPAGPPEAPRSKPRTLVAVRNAGADLDIAVLVPQANGLAPNIRSPYSDDLRERLAGKARDETPPDTDLVERGARMAELMFGGDASRTLAAVGDSELVIVHDASSSGLPYEALGWDGDPTRVTPATRGGIVRHLLTSVTADRGMPTATHAGPLGVLLVINPRGDLENAEREGDTVLAILQRNPRVHVTPLRGAEATVDAVMSGLANRSIDLVHYCGHSFYRGPGLDESGLNLAGGTLTPRRLQELSRVPRLAIFNACQTGRVRGEPASRLSQAFAEFFLHAGVDAYVGTFWLVADENAAMFAEHLYTQLGLGAELGEAVVHARSALQRDGRKDWANYILYGRAGFRLTRGAGLSAAGAKLAPSARVEGKTIVASWPFALAKAPPAMSVTVTERVDGAERPPAIVGPIRVDRRDTWQEGAAIVQWIATVALAEPAAGRGFRLRATDGDPIDVGSPDDTKQRTRSPRDAIDELRDLRALLDQQPDRGHALLTRLLPSADPVDLRAEIDATLEALPDPTQKTRTLWPLHVLDSVDVDDAALEAFAGAYSLAGLDRAQVAGQRYQTKEDWGRYATAPGAAWFLIGGEVDVPLSEGLKPADLSYDVRPSEIVDGGISLALFADNGNGLPAATAIARQIVESNLPYAFHLGDIYYGGSQDEVRENFEAHLAPMFDRTELFMITGNHEMFARGRWFNDLVRRKKNKHVHQRQRAETFRLRGPGFQIIGLDTMFAGWKSGRMRRDDYADDKRLELFASWLSEDSKDLTILLTTNEAWDLGSAKTTRLYDSLRKTIAGRVDLWFWGNVHYAALFEPWPFTDAGSPTRGLVSSCIGHGGYPFYTQKKVGVLPEGLACRWLEQKSRFWPTDKVRPDLGLNGWCAMTIHGGPTRWHVDLTYRDWVGRDRLRAHLVRDEGKSISLDRVEESDLTAIGATSTWHPVAPAERAKP